MSDLTTTAPAAPAERALAAPEAAPGTSVSDVLLEQVDVKVSAIEAQQKRLTPFQTAIATAQQVATTVQAASAKSANPDVVNVYARALEVAQQIVIATKEQGQEVADKITELQDELETLIAQLKTQDPTNPLVQGL